MTSSYTPYQSKRASGASIASFSSASAAAAGPSSPPATRQLGALIRPSASSGSISSSALETSPTKSIHAPRPTRPFQTASWAPSGSSTPLGTSSTPPPGSSLLQQQTVASQSANSSRPSSTGTNVPFNASNSSLGTPFSTCSPTRDRSPAPNGARNAANGSNSTNSSSQPQPNQNQSAVNRLRTPYHSNFQPQGVRRDRTEEFMNKRKSQTEGKKLEEGRLARRLEKLVALHFPLPTHEPPSNNSEKRAANPLSNLSAFGNSLRGKSAKEIWNSVAGSRGEIERAEQGIVKWQEDSDAVRCPICMAGFGLKTRRHHCRLCGRVVCFLPPTLPAPPSSTTSVDSAAAPPGPIRRERCSTFITYEYLGNTAGGEKKSLGRVIEIEAVEIDLNLSAVVAGETANPAAEKDSRKKVRVCRECLNAVIRQQMKTLPVRTPTWLKLYHVLVQLEQEIDDLLPEFQELILGVQQPAMAGTTRPSASAAQSLRKRLLTTLASYDTISKRIRDLPLLENSLPGGSQDRLQKAVAARGTMFLQDKLLLLRGLGSLDELDEGSNTKLKSKQSQPKSESGQVKTLSSLLAEKDSTRPPIQGKLNQLLNEKVGDTELENSSQLAILLEQESLVQSYVKDANAKRQFEDAASLNLSLVELRQEISRLRQTLA